MIKTKRRAILKVDFKNAQGRGGGLGFISHDWNALRLYAEEKNMASIFMAHIIIYCCVSNVVISIPIEEIGWE